MWQKAPCLQEIPNASMIPLLMYICRFFMTGKDPCRMRELLTERRAVELMNIWQSLTRLIQFRTCRVKYFWYIRRHQRSIQGFISVVPWPIPWAFISRDEHRYGGLRMQIDSRLVKHLHQVAKAKVWRYRCYSASYLTYLKRSKIDHRKSLSSWAQSSLYDMNSIDLFNVQVKDSIIAIRMRDYTRLSASPTSTHM